MEQAQKLQAATREVERLYNCRVTAVTELSREEPDQLLNFFLTTKDGRELFLKEIAAHAFRPELDITFTQLAGVRSDNFKFLLPLSHAEGKYFFSAGGAHFHLFEKENLTYFQTGRMSFPELREVIGEMHRKIAPYQFPKQSFRTFQSWLERPVKKIKGKVWGERSLRVPDREFLI